MEKIVPPKIASDIVNLLVYHGYPTYFVGGCVRDYLLGFQPNDWDICTEATPAQAVNVLSNFFSILKTGIKHGTITACFKNEQYEVTTFRLDGDYSDGRHPDSVRFTSSLQEDLKRRDFTINALASSTDGSIYDGTSQGVKDLKDGVIRCVGNPDERFKEDGLRILRALRFASSYSFDIDPETAKAIHRNKDCLLNVSWERIQSELVKMLRGDCLPVLLEYPDIISMIIPEMQKCVGFDQHNQYHQYNVYDHIAHAVGNYDGHDDVVNISLLLHDIGKPLCYTEDERGGHFYGHGKFSWEVSKNVLSRLKFSNEIKNSALELILNHDAKIEPTKKTVRRWVNKLGREQFERLLDIRMADILAHEPTRRASRVERCNALREIYEDLVECEDCFSLKDLKINGSDILYLGIPEGPMIGKILSEVLSLVLNEELENDRKVLLTFANKRINGSD